MKHKHAELIKQWADNPELKFQVEDASLEGAWLDCAAAPAWLAAFNYRIKPQPKSLGQLFFEAALPGTNWDNYGASVRECYQERAEKFLKAVKDNEKA